MLRGQGYAWSLGSQQDSYQLWGWGGGPRPPIVLQGALGYWHDSWDPFSGSGLVIFYSGLERFLFSAAPGPGRGEPIPRRESG